MRHHRLSAQVFIITSITWNRIRGIVYDPNLKMGVRCGEDEEGRKEGVGEALIRTGKHAYCLRMVRSCPTSGCVLSMDPA